MTKPLPPKIRVSCVIGPRTQEGAVAGIGLLAVFCVGLICAHPGVGQTERDQFFEADGIRIRYQVWGEGPRVVLLHGLRDSLETWQRAG